MYDDTPDSPFDKGIDAPPDYTRCGFDRREARIRQAELRDAALMVRASDEEQGEQAVSDRFDNRDHNDQEQWR